MRQTNVLVVGASIAGPALAYWLRRYGASVTVVERAPALREGGYKVDVRGVAVDVVRRMGLLEEVRRRTTDMRGGTFLNGAGRVVATLGADVIGFRDPGDLEIFRGDLARVLYDATREDVEYLFDTSVTRIEPRHDGVRVDFSRGEPRTFDLVVGADGVHSLVRRLTFGPEERFAHDLGLSVAIFTVPNHLDLDRWELVSSGVGRVVNVYSVRQDAHAKAQFFFRTPEKPYDRRDVRRQQEILVEAFAGQGWEVPALLAAMPTSPDFYFDSLSQVRMPRWSSGPVVLLGDAAYCPSPASGQGTSLALVGAYVLAGELAAAGGDHRVAFARYEEEMRGFVELNQKLGRDSVRQMVPGSRWEASLRALMLRVMPYLPGKDRVMEKVMKSMREAAHGITLRDYPAVVASSTSVAGD
ncbi:2-polyprenyl-6-methoxyphenol hydroxylase [Streptoalloteichus tenebrarius]|uniref:2-polyprenyl-6-methoxyphenol hydroxylase n=1 Tax=Streptoalloteichus tenebrarius (strain ATCC 17920 / DSM 40477 / JCM 4838 / CBS 697.72 / NBRC 16177 / NCIMB 11028 / NRRL B-12390 / A12253. 1 / ISP 5477) TaxID=1933 RepID=A0ABT1HWU7_STRSD|nr:FAD-dependent monooxygenase [Streptoalloteichus tenebrarius]MCP2259979.1 2-polyprenyl-6-methoxyphenol hydroxylase [Streptoalloteichus tenebrarius]BFF03909.1 FAD-dependent monooxygenase [Streptoalloteichus tenebrarius]